MSLQKLDKIFDPKSIAVIGASDEEGSVGFRVLHNLVGVGYQGVVYPVTSKKPSVQGIKAYSRVEELPGQVDLAIIAAPARTVPDTCEQCGKAGILGIIILSAGFREIGAEGKALEDRIMEIKKKYNMTLIGPNSLGVIRPHIRLNASFAAKMALPGNIVFISQSAALCTAVLDWANSENIGFSDFVSIGSMIDVGFGDLIDYFGTDPWTKSIIMYIEGLANARKFMSAARHFARTKPIIVVKAGKFGESAKATTSHTGDLIGEDEVYDAALRRAGVIRVEEIEDLFNCAVILEMQPHPEGSNLAIITNSSGPGVMAADALIARGGKLAQLSPETIQALNRVLPSYWSKENPIDILEDATPERYAQVIKMCRQDANINGLLIIFTHRGVANPTEYAIAVAEACKGTNKTVLTSWMGLEDVKEANEILNRNKLPKYSTPERAVKTYMYLYQYTRNLELLYETPEELPTEFSPPRQPLMDILQKAAEENREVLNETEAKTFLEAYHIPTVKTQVAKTEDEAIPIAELMGYEVILSSKKHPLFGPVIIFRTGGVLAELFRGRAVGFPPLNRMLARRIMERTKIYRLLKGSSGKSPTSIKRLEEIMVNFSEMLVDFPQVKEAEISPLVVDSEDAIALGARIIIERDLVSKAPPHHSHLIISPYPKKYELHWKLKDGRHVLLRPIRPEDEPLENELWKTFSEDTQRFRFFSPMKTWFHATLVRYTNIDYDREIAIIAELTDNGQKKMLGVVRMIMEPSSFKTAEVAIVVGDPWQRLGLGSKFMDCIIEIARGKDLETLYALILPDNQSAIRLFREKGFTVDFSSTNEVVKATLALKKTEG